MIRSRLMRAALAACILIGAGFPLAAQGAGTAAMIVVQGGPFLMGSPEGEPGRQPGGGGLETQVKVQVSGFSISPFPVTVGEFRTFIKATGYKTSADLDGGAWTWTRDGWKKDPQVTWSNPGFPQTDRHPVVCISWYDAVAYANWLSASQKRSPAYRYEGRTDVMTWPLGWNVIANNGVQTDPTADGFRLPTEAEWEYAARGGGRAAAYMAWAGGTSADPVAWYAGNRGAPGTHPVGQKLANALGLYDMSGNEWEWCQDWFSPAPVGGSDPTGAAVGTLKVVRGGSWLWDADRARSAVRGNREPGSRNTDGGFRLVSRAPGAAPAAAPAYTVHVQLGHAAEVTSVMVSPDGKYLATGSADFSARIWELSTGRELVALSGHRGKVNSVAFSPDGTRVATGSDDASIMIWDMATGKALKTLKGHRDGVLSVAFSPDGKTIASGAKDSMAALWDLENGTSNLWARGMGSTVRKVQFSPDGRRLFVGCYSGRVSVLNVGDGTPGQTLEGKTGYLSSFSLSRDASRLLTSTDNRITLWDVASGRSLRVMETFSPDNPVALSPDGRFAAGAFTQTIGIWDLSAGTEARRLDGHSSLVSSLVFSSDGSRLVSGSLDRSARVWDVSSGRELKKLGGDWDGVGTFVLARDLRTAISTSTEGSAVRVWDVRDGSLMMTLTGHTNKVTSAAFTQDSSYAVTGSWDGTARIWDLARGKEARRLGHGDEQVTSVAVSPDDRYVLTGGYRRALLWKRETGALVRSYDMMGESVMTVAFSKDGRLVLAGTDSGAVWEFQTESDAGYPIKIMRGHSDPVSSIAMLTGSLPWMATASWDKTVKLWDYVSGQEVGKLEGNTDRITSITVSPDGRSVVTGAVDHSFRLFKLSDHTLGGGSLLHAGAVTAVAYAADGSGLFTASEDGTIRKWSLLTGKLLLTMAVTRKGDSLSWTPEGYFSGSEAAVFGLLYGVSQLSTIGPEALLNTWHTTDLRSRIGP
jgi:WD40 repeat protein